MQTKILSTIGPITCQISQIRKLLKYGDILRTNGSHNTLNWHKKISKLIKSVNPEAVHLFDIPGIKPRTKNQKTILINKGEKICLFYGKKINNKSKLKKIELTKPLPYFTNKKKKFFIIGWPIFI